MTSLSPTDGKIVDSFEEACRNVGISRAQGYREMAAGTLETYLDGRRRKCTRKAQLEYVSKKQRQSAKAAA